MSRTQFPLAPLAILLIIGVLVVGGFAFYRISWLEGYRTGQLVAAGVADGAIVPYAPYRLGCGGLLLALGAIFLLILAVGKFFRFWAWKAAWGPGMKPGGPEGDRWVRRWHRHGPHGPMPPWCWDWEEPSEEEAEGPRADSAPQDVAAQDTSATSEA
jgi:hypothetical protein